MNIFNNKRLTNYETEEQADLALREYADKYKNFYYTDGNANLADVLKDNYGKVNIWQLPNTPSYKSGLSRDVEWRKQLMDQHFNKDFDLGNIANGPEIVIEGTPHIQLITYPIGGKDYPLTGHSEIWGPNWFNIDTKSDDPNYNLFGWFGKKNCATDTYSFLKDVFGNDFDPSTSAGGNWRPIDLPAIVEKLAKKLPGAKLIKEGDKRIVSIPITSKIQSSYKKAVKKREKLIPKKHTEGGKLIPRKFQNGGIPNDIELYMDWYQPFDPTVYAGKKGKRTWTEEDNNRLMWKKAKPVYDELVAGGVDPYVAVALCGNIALESAFNPNAQNGKYRGYVQNQPEFLNYIRQNYGGYDHKHQMQFLIDGLTKTIRGDLTSKYGMELHNRFTAFKKAVLKYKRDVAALVNAWETAYEKSGGQANNKRKNFALYFLKQLGL